MDEDWFYYVIEYSCKKNEYLAEKMNILAKYYETSTCRTCRMHENCSPNVDQSKRKSLKISILASNLAAAQAAVEE